MTAVAATEKPLREVEPNPEAHKVYSETYPRWRAMYEHQLAAADQGLVPHLWKGAGA